MTTSQTTTTLFDNRPKVRRNKLNVLPSNPEASQHEDDNQQRAVGMGRFPSWLHRKLPEGGNIFKTHDAVEGQRLHTVCEEAKCPNFLECWSQKTATFLVMGKECTRACGFCDIDFSKTPQQLDSDEPRRVAESVKALELRHAVITMVARDDLADGGAEHLSQIVHEIRNKCPGTTIELLISDLEGKENSLKTVMTAAPEIFNHNIETVRALSPKVRHKATYDRTLSVLQQANTFITKNLSGNFFVKSGIMVGLGETDQQVRETISDLKEVGCDIITIGQYLQASRHKLRVQAFITPEQFKAYEEYGHSIGVKHMYCGPFVRSSYNARAVFEQMPA